MAFWDTLSGLWSTNRVHLIESPIPSARTDRRSPALELESEKTYFRVTLAQMFLRKQSQFLTDYYPAVYSAVTALFDGKAVDLTNVADESRLTAKQNGDGDVVAKNFVLSPLIPFKGDVVKLAASLHAMDGKNRVRSFLKTMGDFANLLVVPQLSAAIGIAQPLANGLQGLFGEGGGATHLVYANSFVGRGIASVPPGASVLNAGYVAVIRAPEGKVDTGRLWVVNDELREGDSLETSTGFTSFDYMLLRFDVREDRDDFNQLAAIRQPMDSAIEAAAGGDLVKADAFYRVAIAAVLRAPELTRADRRRVVELLKQDYEEAKSGLAAARLVPGAGFDLQARWLQQHMSADEALARPEPTFAEVLGPGQGT